MTTRFLDMRRLLWAACLALALVACDGNVGGDDDGTSTGPTDNDAMTGDAPGGDGTVTGDGTMGDTTEPPDEPDPNKIDQDMLFACSGEASSSPARIRRLERREWVRANGYSLTGYKSSDVPRTNPLDAPLTVPYSTFSRGVGVDAVTLDLYMGVLPDTVTPWTARDARRIPLTYNDGDLRCMFNDAAPDDACIDNYLTTLLERGVLYRPPTQGEFDQLRAFLVARLGEEASADDRPNTLRRTASAAWMMSGALFRSELGQGEAEADGRRKLSDWELAQSLAYMLSDRAPGALGVYRWSEGAGGSSWTPSDPLEGYLAEIEAAAMDGSIQDPNEIQRLVRLYAAGMDEERVDLVADFDPDRRARRGEYWTSHKIQRFFREWLGYEGVELVFKDTPYATSVFEGDMWNQGSISSSWGNLMSGYYGDEPLLSQQLDDMIARIVVEDTDVLRTLLTTRQFYSASSTAYTGQSIDKNTNNVHRPYGILGEVGETRDERWVTLPEDERAGVLTHPAFLAAHGGNFEDDASVVFRGKWVREQLLCQTVPPLELVQVEAQLGPSDPALRARDRIGDAIEGNSECTWCHDLMNPLGYPFEIYNHAGFLREDDHGYAPDGSSVLANMPDPALDGPVSDAVDLSEKLAESDYVKRCFVRQSFRFFVGRAETEADACTLSAMETAYDESGGSFVAMLEALATSDAFLYRHDPEEE